VPRDKLAINPPLGAGADIRFLALPRRYGTRHGNKMVAVVATAVTGFKVYRQARGLVSTC
jgi:hypothetical protein